MTAKFFVNGYNTCEHRDENGNKEYTWYSTTRAGIRSAVACATCV